jgi:hypothetical protein
MTRSVAAIERDGSRARPHGTQDPQPFSGVFEEVIGSVRSSEYGPLLEEAVDVVRRNPGPVLLIGAGVGWLLYRLSRDQSSRVGRRVQETVIADQIPVLNTGNARVYDPDHSPRHPAQDSLESRREASARA